MYKAFDLNDFKTVTPDRLGAKISILFSHTCYCLFSFFDNLYILATVGFLKTDPKKFGKPGFIIWALGVLSSLCYNTFMLRLSYKNESDLKTVIVQNKTPRQALALLAKFSEERRRIMRKMIRNLGDLMISFHELKIAPKVFKINMNYGLVAVSGFMASIVALYDVHKNVNSIKEKEGSVKVKGNSKSDSEEEDTSPVRVLKRSLREHSM